MQEDNFESPLQVKSFDDRVALCVYAAVIATIATWMWWMVATFDHHPRCFSMWLAGGGIRPGMTFGETDDYSYNIVHNPVHVHDLHATLLNCLGIDHTKLTFKFQGRQHRLTDVHGHVVREIIN